MSHWDWEHKSMIKKEVDRIMEAPLKFYSYINRIEWDDFPGLQNILDNSAYAQEELGGNIPADIFMDIEDMFRKSLEKKRDWFSHSNIRLQTFFHLGKLGTVTSSEIADKLGKHPKSVSIYLHEFFDEKLIEEIEDEDARRRRYKLTEKGMQLYSIAKEERWFNQDFIIAEHIILEIEFYTIGRGIGSAHALVYKDIGSLVKEINLIAKKLLDNLKITVNVPPLSHFHMLSETTEPFPDYIMIGSINEDELAIIFAAFNHLQHHQHLKSGESTGFAFIHRLKIIKPEFYFTLGGLSEKDFLSHKETRDYISKTLFKFREKFKING